MEIAQQGDLGAVMDDLTVDVENQGGEGTIRIRALAAADGPGEFVDAQAGDPVTPPLVGGVELVESLAGGAGVGERDVVDRRAAEVGRPPGLPGRRR